LADLCIVTFPSVYHAFRAHKILREQGIAAELISIPRFLSGSCEGLAVRFAAEQLAQVQVLLEQRKVEVLRTVKPEDIPR